ncbi:MAG: hypothetical protein R3F35_23465 [Myxococcota bacterium]
MMGYHQAMDLYLRECEKSERKPRRPNGTLSVKVGPVWRLNCPAGCVAEVDERTGQVRTFDPPRPA